jgi:uncharacterized protein DUF397
VTETQPTLVWRRSRYCESAECVEVAPTPGYVSIRDSKDPDRLVLRFSAVEWAAFVAGVRAGEFDF